MARRSEDSRPARRPEAGDALPGGDQTEQELAGLLLLRLADRRVLYNPFEWEMPDHCLRSVREIRDGLTELLGQLPPDSLLAADLRDLRAVCRTFFDSLRPAAPRGGAPRLRGIDGWRLRDALMAMRETFARVLGGLAQRYSLTPERELARLIAEPGSTL